MVRELKMTRTITYNLDDVIAELGYECDDPEQEAIERIKDWFAEDIAENGVDEWTIYEEEN